MKRIAIGVLVVVLVGGAGLYLARERVMRIALRAMGPSHPFDLQRKAAAPEYASSEAWLARPDTQDRADFVPTGVDSALAQDGASPLPAVAAGSGASATKPVAVFFVHPTTYLRGEDWNDPLRSGTSTAENSQWVLANQASAFNGCCDVYAPRYRQTSIHSLFADREIATQALELAYRDVERAFDQFMSEIGAGRPFILASHSQGTIHLRRLLRTRISGTPLLQRMVAAYLIGGGVTLKELEGTPDVRPCQSATDLHCVVHWATYGPEGRAMGGNAPLQVAGMDAAGPVLCTNPLSWTTGEEPAPASANLGAVAPSGDFNVQFMGEDRARGVKFEPLSAPIPGHTGARCSEGRLVVDEQTDPRFAAAALGQNYHGLDYALFYMNLRTNAQARADAYRAQEPPQPGA